LAIKAGMKAGAVLDIPNGIPAAEWKLRVDLAAAYRLIANHGWDDLISNHISARLPGPEHHFLINPYGLLFSEVTASCLLKVDIDGHVLSKSEYGFNKAGFVIHSAIHAARTDAGCVFHLHTNAGIAVSAQKGGLLPLSGHALILLGRIGYHAYEGITFRDDEKPRLIQDLGDKSLMFLRNHGTLSLGRTIAEAYQLIYWLEKACQIQIAIQSSGVEPLLPNDSVIQEVPRQLAPIELSRLELLWAALLRDLDRRDPGYRN
jgi:ribulose-5-phosphate 4-epimerase/fuculose-1-phosphate aldolase